MSAGITLTVNAESEEAAAKLQEFFSSAAEGFDKLSGAGEFLQELGGKLIAAFSIGALVEFTREAINTAEAIGTLSRQVGFSIETLAALKTQANANGIAWEELRLGLTHFNEVLKEAKQNGGEAMDRFRGLSQAIAVAVEQGKPAEEVYRLIAERFKQLPDGVNKTSAATELFGRNAGQWVTLLNEGADAIDKLKAEGSPITPETVASATGFNRSLREMHEQLEIVFLNFASQILPVLNQAVAALKQWNEQADGSAKAVTVLVDVFKGLATVVVAVGGVFVSVGKAIGYSAAGWVEIYNTALAIVKEIAAEVKTIYQDIVNLAADMIGTLIAGQQAMSEAVRGRFAEARSIISAQIGGIKDDAKTLNADLVTTFGGVADNLGRLYQKLGDMDAGFLTDFMSQWKSAAAFIQNIWSPAPKTGAGPAGTQPAAGSGPAGAAGAGITDQSLKAQQTQLESMRQDLQLREKLISTDPYQSQAEKIQQLLPLQQQELGVLDQQVALQVQILNDGSRNTQEKAEAQKELIKLYTQELEIFREIQKEEASGNFWDQMSAGIKKLNDNWGNLAESGSKFALKTMQDGIDAVSQSLANVIEGTRNWGEAFYGAMRKAITGIIEMAAQYIASKAAMGAVDLAFAAQSKSTAATTTAASGTAGVAKAGEQGGWIGVLIYMGVFLAAMAAIEAIAAGIGRESGGPVEAGRPYIVGERRPELFVPQSSGYIHPSVPSNMSFSAGTGRGGEGSSNPEAGLHINLFSDMDAVTDHIKQNPEFKHLVIDILRGSAHYVQPPA